QSNAAGELNKKIVIACLRGRKLIAFQTDGDTMAKKEILFDGTYKRLRNIVQAPDGSILFCSSNMDGRESTPLKQDDKIYRINFTGKK
ncbi:MAG: PQQ-dependent sugar dehydrogenase, partial [Chitinophagales bacterium]